MCSYSEIVFLILRPTTIGFILFLNTQLGLKKEGLIFVHELGKWMDIYIFK